MGIRSEAWVLKETGKPLVKESLELGEPSATDVVVEVEACGLCHTDLGFAEGSVAPRIARHASSVSRSSIGCWNS